MRKTRLGWPGLFARLEERGPSQAQAPALPDAGRAKSAGRAKGTSSACCAGTFPVRGEGMGRERL